ncbi:hypothetical protein IFM89_026152 [Coptis chinensis]|uniref:Polygalacturonase n=1 Tax=Coptis chinensis TaxID=261450 RepID=A0A835IFQ6_9MAGN|nr:hypothetical protein IFM89_026152 [Coptis chinensis]
MDLKEFFILSLLLCCAQFGWARMPRNYLDETSARHVNVMDFEAVGDGETDDSQKCSSAPTAVGVNGCDDVQINGLKFVNSQGMHVVLNKCNGVKISNVEISAPEDSPNTDGIHFQRCKNVEITNSVIGTGDDCISIGTATSNVNISKVFCGPGHGISVGSLGKHDSAAVEQIHVSNCTLRSTMYGARIKTWQGGSGFAKSITFEDIIIDSTDNPIVIDQYYCNGNHNCGNNTSAVEVSDVKFVNFQGTSSSKIAIKLACSETVACTDIHLRQVHLKTPESKEVKAYCLNVKGTSTDVNPDVPCLDN